MRVMAICRVMEIMILGRAMRTVFWAGYGCSGEVLVVGLCSLWVTPVEGMEAGEELSIRCMGWG